MNTIVKKFHEDLLWCASQMQNSPDKFSEAMKDKHTRRELNQLANDLFSLCEVIVDP